MVPKAARVKKIPFTCEIMDSPRKRNFLIKSFSNPGSGVIYNTHRYDHVLYIIYHVLYSSINVDDNIDNVDNVDNVDDVSNIQQKVYRWLSPRNRHALTFPD